jgi:hypothetical protein
LRDKVTSTGKGGDFLNLPTLAKTLDSWSDEVAEFVLGKDGVKKAEALKTFYRSLPRDVNPAGTAKVLAQVGAMNWFTGGIVQAASMSISAFNIMLRNQERAVKAAMGAAGGMKVRDVAKRKNLEKEKKNKANKIILEP